MYLCTIHVIKTMALSHKNYIYAVIEREFRKSREPIVKFGRTGTDLATRMGHYPKGSIMLCACAVEPSKLEAAEAAVLAGAREMFRPCPNIGREYFWGDIKEMVRHLTMVALDFMPDLVIDVVLDDVEPDVVAPIRPPKPIIPTDGGDSDDESAPCIDKWLEGAIDVTRNIDDWIVFGSDTIGALCDLYNTDTDSNTCVNVRDFRVELKAHLTNAEVWHSEVFTKLPSGRMRVNKNVGVGVKFRPGIGIDATDDADYLKSDVKARNTENLSNFIADRCDIGAGKRVPTMQFLAAFNDWASESGGRMTDKTMVTTMYAKGFDKANMRASGARNMHYMGLAMAPISRSPPSGQS